MLHQPINKDNMMRRNRIFAALLFITSSVCINPVCSGQDSFQVIGKILGGKDLPVPGVSVSMEGILTSPVITNDSGEFQLDAPSGDVWLIITPVGKYKSRREFLNNRSNITIQLTEDDMVAGYDEILNIYRTTLRRDFISASHTPDPDNINLYPYQSVDQYFQGIVPGLFVTGHSGMPGSGGVSYLRGVRSMFTNNQPLYEVLQFPDVPRPAIVPQDVQDVVGQTRWRPGQLLCKLRREMSCQ